MTARTRYFVVSSLLVMVVGVGSGLVAYYGGFPMRALSDRGPDELQYLPADASLVAYADVRAVMASDLRRRLVQAAPNRQTGQQELQDLTGINVETDIDHVVACGWGDGSRASSSALVLATGIFNEAKIEALMHEHGAQTEAYRGKRIIVAPGGHRGSPPPDPNVPTADGASQGPQLAVAFLKPGLAALGTSDLIRRAIDLEAGGDNLTTNNELMDLVRSIDNGTVWAAGRFDALQKSGKLPAGAAQLPPISWFSVSAQITDGVSGVLRADTTDEDAARKLRDVIQGFLALAQLQAGSKPELQRALQSLQVSGSGRTVGLTFSIPGQLIDLIAPAGNRPRRQAAH